MNRRNFALSWGRKIFFGISWPLSSILSVLYLRSFILPESQTDWIYFFTTFVGHIGILNAIAYFIFYCPLALLLPNYYFSRIWSLILILGLNAFIVVDALSFSSYHLHVYSYISQLVLEEGIHHLLGSSTGLLILIAGLIALSILLWTRGEMLWRYMQGRFSNPVKNWYLVLIVTCLIISKVLFVYGDIHPKLADLFPINLNFSRPEQEFYDNRRFFYPKDSLACQAKSNPNIVFLIIKEWGADQFTADTMPKTFHMRRHATNFLNHRGVASDADSGLFAFDYSLPATYQTAAHETKSALHKEMTTRGYEVIQFRNDEAINDEASMMNFRQWLEKRAGDELRPYHLSIIFSQHPSEVDKFIQEAVLLLQKEDLLKNTHIVITGATHGPSSSAIPLLWIFPDRKNIQVSHIVTQYDFAPSFMQRVWNCKKAFKSSSIGGPIEKTVRDWYLVTTEKGYQIVDLKENATLEVESGIIKNSGAARRELIFPALGLMTKFNRPE